MEHRIRAERYDDETSTLFDVTYCGFEVARTGASTLREPGESLVADVCPACVEAEAKAKANDV